MKKNILLAALAVAALFSALSFGGSKSPSLRHSDEEIKIVHKARWENI